MSTTMDFVTVVTVGLENDELPPSPKPRNHANLKKSSEDNNGFVTVLTIGDLNAQKEKTEEVLVYRLPGERLGFGLKFEGGTKATEFVKRLYIQSCAPNSPASRAQCSWGNLREGDQVLEIDSLPVTNMTRIDCVRCLKDSNVVIKLLVKHVPKSSLNANDITESLSKSTEDLPLVICAEKKRVPPPPPPVPPRRIPKKHLSENSISTRKDVSASTSTPPQGTQSRYQQNEIMNGNKCTRFQSPRSSGKLKSNRQSPEASRNLLKDRRVSDGSPPDAEVYLDVISQELNCNLSESDDTGSSISTVIDRLSSYPTTTNSSFAGSVPSTPTFIPKQLNLTESNSFDVDEIDHILPNNCLPSRFSSFHKPDEVNCVLSNANQDEMFPHNNFIKLPGYYYMEENNGMMPPVNFQDAPLSYGNEDVQIMEATIKTIAKHTSNIFPQIYFQYEDENGNCVKSVHVQEQVKAFPTVRLQSISQKSQETNNVPYLNSNENNEITDKSISELNLPRLVNFVPKTNKTFGSNEQKVVNTYTDIISNVKAFLENEIRIASSLKDHDEEDNTDYHSSYYRNSSQLATIGEDDEDLLPDLIAQRSSSFKPVALIANIEDVETNPKFEEDSIRDVDNSSILSSSYKHTVSSFNVPKAATVADASCIMEAPPSCSRQPPDGDEFPDYHETTIRKTMSDFRKTLLPTTSNTLWKNNTASYLYRDQQSSCSVRDKIAIFSNPNGHSTISKTYASINNTCENAEEESSLNGNKQLSKSVIPFNISNKSDTKTNINSAHEINFDKKINSELGGNGTDSCSLTISHTRFSSQDSYEQTDLPKNLRMHNRSQSLINISTNTDMSKNDKWSLLAEQRRKSLSKLKGLIIPERVIEKDIPTVPDLPEIKSQHVPLIDNLGPTICHLPINASTGFNYLTTPNLNPPWNSNVPKYSPAFKRKTLNVYTAVISKSTENSVNNSKTINDHISAKPVHKANVNNIPTSLSLNDAPKSLESITSPTRSDCSFEYFNCSSPDIKLTKTEFDKFPPNDNYSTHILSYKDKTNTGRLEDESDNDSAVSSSQSSYISKTSPPTSPNHHRKHFISESCAKDLRSVRESEESQYDFQNQRLLKPQSVDAINRKNILASAKCRSGRDLKIGSPLIQRKFDEIDSAICETNEIQNQPTELNASTTVTEQNINIPDEISKIEKPIEVKKSKEEPLSKKITVPRDAKIPVLTDHRNLFSKVRASSVNDLRKSFENLSPIIKSGLNKLNQDLVIPPLKKSTTRNIKTVQNTSQIDCKKKPLIVEKVSEVNEPKMIDNEVVLGKNEEEIILQPSIPGGSVGITLAGGSDYETKNVTIHKIRENSPAYRDGRLAKGDKILCINGKTLKERTHKEIVLILKEPLSEVSIIREKEKNSQSDKLLAPFNPKCEKQTIATNILSSERSLDNTTLKILLVKNIAGLGFSLEGGRDLLGEGETIPLTIKKIFKGGAAEKLGTLHVGDQLLAINGIDVSELSRVEAWSVIKKITEGTVVTLTIRR